MVKLLLLDASRAHCYTQRMLYIPVLIGSAREGRITDKAAAYVAKLLKQRPDVQVELLDIRDLLKDMRPELTDCPAWDAVVKKADGLIIVAPEYNHGYPGPLKQLLDGSKAYGQKPVAICGTSNGGMGGVRMVEQLRLVLLTLGAVLIKQAVYFSFHQNLWNEDGSIKDESHEKRLGDLFNELIWYAQHLQKARQEYPLSLPI